MLDCAVVASLISDHGVHLPQCRDYLDGGSVGVGSGTQRSGAEGSYGKCACTLLVMDDVLRASELC